jgi:hypothetical protein
VRAAHTVSAMRTSAHQPPLAIDPRDALRPQGRTCARFRRPVRFDLSATSQQYFSLRTNQPPTISQQYFSLRTNQHQPPAKRTGRVLWDHKATHVLDSRDGSMPRGPQGRHLCRGCARRSVCARRVLNFFPEELPL